MKWAYWDVNTPTCFWITRGRVKPTERGSKVSTNRQCVSGEWVCHARPCPQGSKLKLGSLPEGHYVVVIFQTLIENTLHTLKQQRLLVKAKVFKQLIDWQHTRTALQRCKNGILSIIALSDDCQNVNTFLYALLMSPPHPFQSILHQAERDLYESVTQTISLSSAGRNTIPGHQDKAEAGDITR